jgi:hypothetical protein
MLITELTPKQVKQFKSQTEINSEYDFDTYKDRLIEDSPKLLTKKRKAIIDSKLKDLGLETKEIDIKTKDKVEEVIDVVEKETTTEEIVVEEKETTKETTTEETVVEEKETTKETEEIDTPDQEDLEDAEEAGDEDE